MFVGTHKRARSAGDGDAWRREDSRFRALKSSSPSLRCSSRADQELRERSRKAAHSSEEDEGATAPTYSSLSKSREEVISRNACGLLVRTDSG